MCIRTLKFYYEYKLFFILPTLALNLTLINAESNNRNTVRTVARSCPVRVVANLTETTV